MDVYCCRCQHTNGNFFSIILLQQKQNNRSNNKNSRQKSTTNNFTVNNCNAQTKKWTQYSYHMLITLIHDCIISHKQVFFSLQQCSSFMEMSLTHIISCDMCIVQCACRQNKDAGRLNGGEREKWSLMQEDAQNYRWYFNEYKCLHKQCDCLFIFCLCVGCAFYRNNRMQRQHTEWLYDCPLSSYPNVTIKNMWYYL